MNLQRLYRCFAVVYDPGQKILWDRWVARQAERRIGSLLVRHAPPECDVLDLGCGTGRNLERLIEAGIDFRSYRGIDFSEPMLARARSKFSHDVRVRFENRDLTTLGDGDGPCDLVLCTWVAELLDEPGGVLERSLSLLRPGGVLLWAFVTRPNALVRLWAGPYWKLNGARFVGPEVFTDLPCPNVVHEHTWGLYTILLAHAEARRSSGVRRLGVSR